MTYRFFILFVISIITLNKSYGSLRVEITKGRIAPVLIAIPSFYGNSPKLSQTGREISTVISNNLENSNVFKKINSKAYIQDLISLQTKPNFANWKIINAKLLLVGNIQLEKNKKLKIEFRLFDILSRRQLVGLSYKTSKNNWRRIAHKISDAIYKRITGVEGYFDTFIAYVHEEGSDTNKKRRIAIMDQDGKNHSFLTNGKRIVLTPRIFSAHNNQLIAYLDYGINNKTPRVKLLNLTKGTKGTLGVFPGMTFAPRFSPDGKSLLMSITENGNSSIYIMDIKTKKVKRLTRGPVIDTSACFSPKADKIVFNSNRGGTPQIYVMNSNGSNIQRISFGNGSYASPVWSPSGDLIAFIKIVKKKFYIGVMSPDGTGERLISTGYIVEDPTWSTNGRSIMFTKQEPVANGGKTALYVVDVSGHNKREIKTPQNGSNPSWAKLY